MADPRVLERSDSMSSYSGDPEMMKKKKKGIGRLISKLTNKSSSKSKGGPSGLDKSPSMSEGGRFEAILHRDGWKKGPTIFKRRAKEDGDQHEPPTNDMDTKEESKNSEIGVEKPNLIQRAEAELSSLMQGNSKDDNITAHTQTHIQEQEKIILEDDSKKPTLTSGAQEESQNIFHKQRDGAPVVDFSYIGKSDSNRGGLKVVDLLKEEGDDTNPKETINIHESSENETSNLPPNPTEENCVSSLAQGLQQVCLGWSNTGRNNKD